MIQIYKNYQNCGKDCIISIEPAYFPAVINKVKSRNYCAMSFEGHLVQMSQFLCAKDKDQFDNQIYISKKKYFNFVFTQVCLIKISSCFSTLF